MSRRTDSFEPPRTPTRPARICQLRPPADVRTCLALVHGGRQRRDELLALAQELDHDGELVAAGPGWAHLVVCSCHCPHDESRARGAGAVGGRDRLDSSRLLVSPQTVISRSLLPREPSRQSWQRSQLSPPSRPPLPASTPFASSHASRAPPRQCSSVSPSTRAARSCALPLTNLRRERISRRVEFELTGCQMNSAISATTSGHNARDFLHSTSPPSPPRCEIHLPREIVAMGLCNLKLEQCCRCDSATLLAR